MTNHDVPDAVFESIPPSDNESYGCSSNNNLSNLPCTGDSHCPDMADDNAALASTNRHPAGSVRRNLSLCGGLSKTISFDAIVPDLTVRITDDGHLLALDFLSVLANGDRKKASQTLARINSRTDLSELLTLRRVDGKQKSRKLVSFSNAVQLLLVLPKRTVKMETRRAIAGVLTDFFEYRHQQKEKPERQSRTLEQVLAAPPPSQFSFMAAPTPSQFSFGGFGSGGFHANTQEDRVIAQRRAQVDLRQREMELERLRARLPIERLVQCIELMERCGPMSDEEQRKFRSLISEQAITGIGQSEEQRRIRACFQL